MKIRSSFVANSSSSSFIVKNTKWTEEEIETELRRILQLYNEMMNTNYIYEDCFGNISKYSKEAYLEDVKEIQKYKSWWDGYGYEKEKNIGKLFINSASDNTIPSELFDIIEKKFDAYRYHLG